MTSRPRPSPSACGRWRERSRYAAPGRINLIGEHTDYNHGFVAADRAAGAHRRVLRAADDRRADRPQRPRDGPVRIPSTPSPAT